MSERDIISYIPNRQIFMELLTKNPGLIVIKFGAKWCGPCKRIKNVVHGFFASSPDDVLCCDIDVDESVIQYIKDNVDKFKGESIVGPKGKDGKNGVDGKDGINGKDGTSVSTTKLQKMIDDK